jgi:hypothetical protein
MQYSRFAFTTDCTWGAIVLTLPLWADPELLEVTPRSISRSRGRAGDREIKFLTKEYIGGATTYAVLRIVLLLRWKHDDNTMLPLSLTANGGTHLICYSSVGSASDLIHVPFGRYERVAQEKFAGCPVLCMTDVSPIFCRYQAEEDIKKDEPFTAREYAQV